MFLIGDTVVVTKSDNVNVGSIVRKKSQFNMYGGHNFQQVDYVVKTADDKLITCKEDEMFKVGDKILIYYDEDEFDMDKNVVSKTISNIYISDNCFRTTDDFIYYTNGFKKVKNNFVYETDCDDDDDEYWDSLRDAGYVSCLNDMAEFFSSIEGEQTVFTDAIAKIKGENFGEYADFFMSLHDDINGLIEFCDTVTEVKAERLKSKNEDMPVLTYKQLRDMVGYDFKFEKES